MILSVEVRLYPNKTQESILESWLGSCCWLYNQALEHRIKAYNRRKESSSRYDQYKWAAVLRNRIRFLREVPSEFVRDAIRRVDLGMKSFFRRIKDGEKPGHPRFRSRTRYNSLECLIPNSYIRFGNLLYVPKLGLVKCRVGDQNIAGQQKLMRVIRRASGWYAQVVVDNCIDAPLKKRKFGMVVGIDVGLQSFATLDTGEKIPNPRYFLSSQEGLQRACRKFSRCCDKSNNRRKQAKKVSRIYEKITRQRKGFAHRESRKIINRFDFISFEKLNVKGLVRSNLAKSIMDASWSRFLYFLTYKAECAGKRVVVVDPKYTSQTCPSCWRIKKKLLSERIHQCPNCGLILDRDEAAAKVILARALGIAGATACGGAGLYIGKSTNISQSVETGSLGSAVP